eukprot:5795663-Pleurochrysis_carterae.AAC.3
MALAAACGALLLVVAALAAAGSLTSVLRGMVTPGDGTASKYLAAEASLFIYLSTLSNKINFM